MWLRCLVAFLIEVVGLIVEDREGMRLGLSGGLSGACCVLLW
jgi:hypothetical protein